MSSIPTVLDCDPGHDDAIALWVAGASEALDLRAVTTVGGNQLLEKCTMNACRVLSVAGMTNVPVAAGAASPLVRNLRIAEDVHGKSGLDGPVWDRTTVRPDDASAVDLLRRIVLNSAEPVAVIATGPLTNIATFLLAYSELIPRLRSISWMGGSTDRGNVTPYAEFNAVVDPEAVRVVLDSGVPMTMCGLNVTHQALVTDQIVAAMHDLTSPLGDIAVELMTFFGATYRRVFGFSAPPLHDPVAVASVIDPTLVHTTWANVEVETVGEWTSGATVVDLDGYTGRTPNCHVAVDLDVHRFWRLVLRSIAAFGS